MKLNVRKASEEQLAKILNNLKEKEANEKETHILIEAFIQNKK